MVFSLHITHVMQSPIPYKQIAMYQFVRRRGSVCHVTHRGMHTLALLPPLFSLVLAQLFSYVSSKHSYSILCAHLSFCSVGTSGCCHKCNSKSLAPCFCRTQSLGPSLELREVLSRTPRSAAHRPVSVPLRCHVTQQKGCFFSLLQQAGTPPYLCPHTFQWQQDELLLPA